jgi:beta-phosphoglucomutase-like phosphatase (HAD superfamily)
MSPARAPFADLDDTLRHTWHLLFLFDGAICDLFDRPTAHGACDDLRKVIAEGQTLLPADIAETADPFEILAYASDYLGHDMGIRVEAELTQLEDSAAANAEPVPYVDDAIRACYESGRSVTVVSRNRARAVEPYLRRHHLTHMISSVIARNVPDPGTVSYAHLIERAVAELHTDPALCAFVCTTADAVSQTEVSGVYRIGYARSALDRQTLSSAGASATIMSLADLTLRLRAQPLPN